ncbi:MAG: hypothetical protein WAP23_03620 [Candidatus Spechtbacterales bacterium]
MARERIANLQKRLLSYKQGQHEKYVSDYLISITEPFDRLRDQFLQLFDIDILKKDTGSGAFIGTPSQLRAIMDDLLVLAEISGINLERAVWKKYPDKCPYCMTKPCGCGGHKSRPHRRLRIRFPKTGLTLAEAQRMLAEIYPEHPLPEAVLHVVEEIDETETEIIISGRDNDIRDEFADVFARISGLATRLEICLEGLIP